LLLFIKKKHFTAQFKSGVTIIAFRFAREQALLVICSPGSFYYSLPLRRVERSLLSGRLPLGELRNLLSTLEQQVAFISSCKRPVLCVLHTETVATKLIGCSLAALRGRSFRLILSYAEIRPENPRKAEEKLSLQSDFNYTLSSL
jgi:hypothetical protein